MKYFKHTTTEGERWDQIAALYYGDATKWRDIVNANPHVMISNTLEGGLELQLPEPETTTQVAETTLPIWKRSPL